jgi:hypothetical protein
MGNARAKRTEYPFRSQNQRPETGIEKGIPPRPSFSTQPPHEPSNSSKIIILAISGHLKGIFDYFDLFSAQNPSLAFFVLSCEKSSDNSSKIPPG